MNQYNILNKLQNKIKKSKSSSKNEINKLNSTFSEFPIINKEIINQNLYVNGNKKINLTLTEWRKNALNINDINKNNIRNCGNKYSQYLSNSKRELKDRHLNYSATNLHYYINNNENSNINSNIDNNINNNKKKSLILDLDESLVHSSFYPFERASDLTLPITVNNKRRLVYILRRPYLMEFMKEMSSYYEIIIYTSSIPEYSSNLLDELDKYKIISRRYYRYHCIFINGLYIKDLRIIGKPLKDLIIIDNNPISYLYNINNGLPILSFHGDPQDIELLKLIPLLKYLSNVEDVTKIIPQIVNRDKNKIKFSLINKLINNEILNNTNTDLESNNKRKNCLCKDNLNKYILKNGINNLPNSNNSKNNINNDIINSKNNQLPINNNFHLNNYLNKDDYPNRNFNESNELRDSVFSPEEPNINISNYLKVKEHKSYNNYYQLNQNNNNLNSKNTHNSKRKNNFLSKNPIIKNNNNKSFTPDLKDQMPKFEYNENGQTNNKFNNFNQIEQFKKINNECTNNTKNNENYLKYKNNNAIPNNQINNIINYNIMKYFIPNSKLEKNNNNNNFLDNTRNNIFQNYNTESKHNNKQKLNLKKDNYYNQNNNIKDNIKENNNYKNYIRISNYKDNNYSNENNKINDNDYPMENTKFKINFKPRRYDNINYREEDYNIEIYKNINDYNNYLDKNNIENPNIYTSKNTNQDNNYNLNENQKNNEVFNNNSKLNKTKYILNNNMEFNNNMNLDNLNKNNNNNYSYNNINNNLYLKNEYLDNNKHLNNNDFYKEKIESINDKINEIRNSLNTTKILLKENKNNYNSNFYQYSNNII